MNFATSYAPTRPAPPGPDEIRQDLQRLLPLLAEFGRREEAQFMAIGDQLGDFLLRTRALSSTSHAVIDSLLRKEGDDVLGSLHTLMDDLEEHIARLHDDARGHQEALQQVGSHIQQIDTPLQGLSKVIKILLSLSFSTKVESTQGHSVVVLNALAEDLKSLAGKIHGKTEAIRERLKSMSTLATGAQEKTRNMADVSLHQAGSNLQQCRTLLGSIDQRRGSALSDARRLQDHSQQIAAAINDIIASVQFHDITRQQVEHVQLALQDFCQRLSYADNTPRLGIETVDLCRIQSAQLSHTRRELVGAVVRMITSLRSIAPTVQQLAHQTRTLATSTEAVGASLFRDVEPVLGAVTNIIASADQDDQTTLTAVGAVLDVLNELSQLLQDVESIGTEMKMISLNAGITAAHNLERGAGLGVIARSIQALSGEVLARTDEFAAVYSQMARLAKELENSRAAVDASDRRGTSELNAAAATFLTRMQETNQGGLQLLHSLDQDAKRLAADVLRSADQITIHHEAGKRLDPLITELDRLAARLHSDDPDAEEAKILDLISQNYTMQSERRVHDEVRQSGNLSDESAGVDHTGLGSNVELF